MTTPFSLVARRTSFEPRALRGASLAAVLAAVFIVVGGGVVRVTGSGLGCPDWPTCADGTLAPTPAMGWHGAIDFGNRLLTGVLCVVVGWTIVVARLQREEDRQITRWAWIQFWIVLLNAVVGGLTVLAKLSPYMVAAHFIAAMLLLTAAAVTREKVEGLSRVPERGDPQTRRLSVALTVATAFLVVMGTLTTGTGPHAGDSSSVERMPFPWFDVTLAHGAAAGISAGSAIALWRSARAQGARLIRRRASMYLAIFACQAILGIVQSMTSLPAVMVVLHLLGASLIWVGAVRVLLAASSRHSLDRSTSSKALVSTVSCTFP